MSVACQFLLISQFLYVNLDFEQNLLNLVPEFIMVKLKMMQDSEYRKILMCKDHDYAYLF